MGSTPVFFSSQPEGTTNYLIILLEAYLHFFLFAENSLQKLYMTVGNDTPVTSILREGKYKLVISAVLKTFLPVPIQKTLAQDMRNTSRAFVGGRHCT